MQGEEEITRNNIENPTAAHLRNCSATKIIKPVLVILAVAAVTLAFLLTLNKEKPKMSGSPVVVSASGKHTATLIFLHGLGDTGHGWASSLADVRPSHLKIVCPTAQIMPVTLNSGFQMPAWFDLKSLDPSGPEDERGIEKSKAVIDKLIEDEIKNGIEPSRIVLGGFSQGGALALYTTLTNKHRVGGVIALSCWLPLHKKFPGAASVENRNVPCLQVHGDCDPVVPYRWGQLTSTTLKAFLVNHEFKTYKGLAHTSSAAELQDVRDFLLQLVPGDK